MISTHSPNWSASFAASGVAALVNFPLWKAAAIAQSGFKLEGGSARSVYYAALQPPYVGVGAVLFGMTWARAAIFWGSAVGKEELLKRGASSAVAAVAPPLCVSTVVQIINMPIIRASITLQDPQTPWRSTYEALSGLLRTKGVRGLWHGTSAGIIKAVPKYVTAVVVKDLVADVLPEPATHNQVLTHSAIKSLTAGVCGAVLTNPADVLRNEMFRTDCSLRETAKRLCATDGLRWVWRGCDKNLVAVAVPIALTIFLSDVLSEVFEKVASER